MSGVVVNVVLLSLSCVSFVVVWVLYLLLLCVERSVCLPAAVCVGGGRGGEGGNVASDISKSVILN